MIVTIILKPQIRNPLIYSIVSLFFLLAILFLFQGFLAPPWRVFKLEVAFWVIATLPLIFFIFSRWESVALARREIQDFMRFNQLKDEFLTVASHELRTPLSVINGFADILLREKLGSLNDEQKRRLRKMLVQGERLTRILDELLDLSRVRSGKIEIRRDVFDLVPVLKACLDDHQIVCEQQKIELLDQLPDVLPDVAGDLERVTQIVVNLLNNAIKYTPAGGRVTVSAWHDERRNEVYVEVRDTGIGIDDKDLPRIFEDFYRANQSDVKKCAGTGLGLAIVKQLTEAQGGRVGVFSEGVGKGSCFYFTIPSAKILLQKKPISLPSF